MHIFSRIASIALLLALAGAPGRSLPAASNPTHQAAIHSVLDRQVTAWNRGDIAAFMQGYKNSGDTTFVGKSVEHGYAKILARYQRTYSDKQKMGALAFTDLTVRPLDARYATVTGRFHLSRGTQGGGDASGIFSLVFEKTAAGWKIILDHTS